jgi:glycosyltransferase involved in cell wall biosynthesis
MSNTLLTIAVLTYNRAPLLDLCFDSIVGQVRQCPEHIELIVSNNASTDNTREVVSRYFGIYPKLRYTENEINRGFDFNADKCFRLARSNYVWLFSDDDLLLPRAIERIVPLLKQETFGIVSLATNFYPCKGTIDKSLFPYEPLSFRIYDKPKDFAREVHFWLTYITGIIVNRQLVSECDMLSPAEGGSLIQLGWVIPALYGKFPSAIVETPLILGRALDVLDFKLFDVFGTSYPSVLKRLCRQKVLPRDSMEMLIELIITKYFTHYINSQNSYHHGERPLLILGKSFWNQKAFWVHLFPRFVRRTLHKISSKLKLALPSTMSRNCSRIIANRSGPSR